MQRIMKRSALLGLAVAIALQAVAIKAADKAPNDRLLPQKTYVYVTVPSVSEFKTRFDKSLTGQMLKDPKLADFLADVHKKIGELSEEFQKKSGLKLDDVLSIPDGEVSFAVFQIGDTRNLGGAFIIDFGKGSSTVTALLEKGAAAAESEGFKKSTKDFEGSQIIVYKKGEGEKKEGDKDGGAPAKTELGSEFAYVIKDNTLIVSTATAAVEDMLKRWDGKHAETLAEVPGYKAIIDASKQSTAPSVLTWYINPVTLVQAALAAGGDADPNIGMVMAMLPTLGVTNFKAIGGTMHLVTDEFDSESRTLLYVDQPTTGLLNIFQFPATEQKPPKWVSEDSTAYFVLNWDIAGAFNAIETMVDQFMGPGATANQIDQLAQNEGGPKIHLKKDVIDNLTGSFQVVTSTPNSDKPEATQFLVSIGVKDAKAAKALLDKVSKIPRFPGQAREFKGETIYNIEAGQVLGSDGERKMGVGVVNDQIMVASDVARLEQVIVGDSDRKPLVDSDKFKALAKHFPAKTSMLGYQQQDTQVKAIYEMFRSGKATESVGSSDLGKFLEGIDFKKLPEFQVIDKYLPGSGYYVVPHPQGALFVGFTLNKK